MMPAQAEMTILSCFLRNNLPATTCKDILSTFKKCFPHDLSLKQMKYDTLWQSMDADFAHKVHYCEKCGDLFPSDLNIYACWKAGCNGVRYIGQN